MKNTSRFDSKFILYKVYPSPFESVYDERNQNIFSCTPIDPLSISIFHKPKNMLKIRVRMRKDRSFEFAKVS